MSTTIGLFPLMNSFKSSDDLTADEQRHVSLLQLISLFVIY